MATIRERVLKNGSTSYLVVVRKNGAPYLSKTFTNKQKGEAWAKKIEVQADDGSYREVTKEERTLTLSAALERYKTEVLDEVKKRREIGFIKQWLTRPIASKFLSSIRAKDITEAMAEMRAEGKGSRTINLHLAVVSHLYTVATKDWGMESLSNPVLVVRKPKTPAGRDRLLTPEELERLLEACRSINPDLADIVLFAKYTAMREGELIDMTWDNADLKQRVYHIIGAKDPTVEDGRDRDVPLTLDAVSILENLKKHDNDKRVWSYRTTDGLRASFGKAKLKAHISNFHFHDLRHHAATDFVEKGLDLISVSAITGHKSLQMLKRYTHPSTKSILDKLDQQVK
jgi:integrase